MVDFLKTDLLETARARAFDQLSLTVLVGFYDVFLYMGIQ
jgi:hypothetical protein